MEQDELVYKLKKRDEKVFASLIETNSRLLWTVASGYLSRTVGCSAEDVEECVSDVFFELWEHPERFDPAKGSLKSYLCIITKNKAISIFRKKVQQNTLCLDDYRQVADVEQEDMLDQDYVILYAAIEALPEPTREILIRRYYHDEKPAAIAEKTGLAKKEVENRLYRGKQTLAGILTNIKEG